MINIELRLLTAMSYTGNFTPITEGEITLDHFLTDQGKSIFLFMTGYHATEGGLATTYPPLSVLRSRFDNVEFPDPDPGDSVNALAHEMKVLKMRADLQVLSQDMDIVSKQVNPTVELDKLASRLRGISEKMSPSRVISLADHINQVLYEYDNGTILPEGIPYPWETLTKGTRGMQRKEVIIFAGRPKSRKTFTATHAAVNAVKKHAKRVLFFTPEMPPMQILLRAIADFAELRYTEFKNSALSNAEADRLLDIANRFGKLDSESDQDYEFRFQRDYEFARAPMFHVLQSTGQTLEWMRHKIEQYEPDIVLADSLYRQAPERSKKNDADWKAQTANSRGFKDLMMEMNTAGIITHQMTRGSEQNLGDLSSLSFADGFGQDADLVMRVITGKVDGEERSALLCLAARELSFDGVFINNRPCYDYSEVGVITKRSLVKKLLERDNDDEEEGENGAAATGEKKKHGAKKKVSSDAAKGKTIQAAMMKHRKTFAGPATAETDDLSDVVLDDGDDEAS